MIVRQNSDRKCKWRFRSYIWCLSSKRMSLIIASYQAFSVIIFSRISIPTYQDVPILVCARLPTLSRGKVLNYVTSCRVSAFLVLWFSGAAQPTHQTSPEDAIRARSNSRLSVKRCRVLELDEPVQTILVTRAPQMYLPSSPTSNRVAS